MLKQIIDITTKESIASHILNQLPDWFGLPESTQNYVNESKNMPFWAYYADEKPVGFISLKATSPATAEIFVMGILKEYHRRGIGTLLWNAFLEYAKENGYEYIQVKTVRKGHYKEYDITNRFYESLGFKELECFPTLWDENNPCQVYVINNTPIENPSVSRPTALITGASRGIGKAIAEAFAAAGYELILTCSKTMSDLNSLAVELTQKNNIPCHAFQADMGKPEDVARLFADMRAAGIENLDVLVNNAGISYVGLLTDMSVEEWNRVIAVNLNSCFYTGKYAVPLMLKKHAGRIINISSVWGNVGASMEVAYSASKGGINAFTKALAKELAPSNIQVNAIACGVIDTAMNACFSEDDMAALTAEIPADRLGKPEEVAQLALQLAQAPAYMTGQIITIDGGWL